MKIFKWVLVSLAALGIVAYVVFTLLRANTKKYSPEDTVGYIKNQLELSVFYNRPYKKGRPIFGGLVPFDKVWRTGANEATVFTTNQDLIVNGQDLPAGEYTLWTIPGPEQWQVIFNGKQYTWGVNTEGEASRDPKFDVVNAFVPVEKVSEVTEQFTISFKEVNSTLYLLLEWDQTRIPVPLDH